MVHPPICQARLVIIDQCDAVFSWDIFRRNDHELVPIDSRAECNLCDPAAWNAASHGCAEKHAGKYNVVDIKRLSRNLAAALQSRHGLTNNAIRAHSNSSTPRFSARFP